MKGRNREVNTEKKVGRGSEGTKGWEEKKQKRWRTNRKTDRRIDLKVKEGGSRGGGGKEVEERNKGGVRK